ncbi:Hypothetical protein FKW44_014772 [Caligus rogercresseyi]|uniref:Uncharacterized protein n=1 Tax=Caligus rogercresseyi TaxID=217165 RepID=A0A7T8H082_CALRO|nr:Hypothetical protein FKW44_014772 [Caligus rogercresseyi]
MAKSVARSDCGWRRYCPPRRGLRKRMCGLGASYAHPRRCSQMDCQEARIPRRPARSAGPTLKLSVLEL